MKKGNKIKIIKIFILLALTIGFLLLAIKFTFLSNKECTNYACFREQMVKCSKANYINDNEEATWKYKILGRKDNLCAIEVKLLQAKQGELGLESLAGETMECSYPLGVSDYPEKDLEKCHGSLKEEMQTIIINKLHTYIVQNLGQIKSGLNENLLYNL